MNSVEDWVQLPDHVLLQIFRYLTAEVIFLLQVWEDRKPKTNSIELQDILNVSSVSRDWYRVSRDELLWKALFRRDWNINPKIGIAAGMYEKLPHTYLLNCVLSFILFKNLK